MSCRQTIAVLAAILVCAASLPAQQTGGKQNNCIACHSELMRSYSMPVELYEQDIHNTVGITCSDCHGGDPSKERRHDRDNPEEGFIGAPAEQDIPAFCDRCHGDAEYMRGYNPSLPTDQMDKYRTSRHGQLLLEEADTLVAQCVSCHSVHDIRRVGAPAAPVYPLNLPGTCAKCHSDDEYMADYGIPTDQYEEYASSVHGVPLLEDGDVGAPACNDCHSNHGAFPPEVEDISAVCGMCHVNNQRLYRESFHSDLFEMLGSPGCVTCHGNHGIEPPTEAMLAAGDSSACGACHAQDPDDPGFAVGLAMKSMLDSLTARLDSARQIIHQADQMGMETSDLELAIRDVRQSYITSRTQVHTFSDSAVAAAVQPGLEQGKEIIAEGHELLREHEDRRWWLAGATVVLLLVIAGLYLKLKQVEDRD